MSMLRGIALADIPGILLQRATLPPVAEGETVIVLTFGAQANMTDLAMVIEQLHNKFPHQRTILLPEGMSVSLLVMPK